MRVSASQAASQHRLLVEVGRGLGLCPAPAPLQQAHPEQGARHLVLEAPGV